MIPLAAFEAVIDASGIAPQVEAMLPVGVRARQLKVRTLLAGMCLTQADSRPAHLTRVHQALTGLPEDDQRRLGVVADWKNGPRTLTYRQTERTFGLIARALGNDKPDGLPPPVLQAVCDDLLEASEPPLKLVLLENPGQGGSLNHLGVEVDGISAVDTEQARLGRCRARPGRRARHHLLLRQAGQVLGQGRPERRVLGVLHPPGRQRDLLRRGRQPGLLLRRHRRGLRRNRRGHGLLLTAAAHHGDCAPRRRPTWRDSQARYRRAAPVPAETSRRDRRTCRAAIT